MIFINWYRIDWFFWDWIFIGILIIFILILRFLRRIYRWKTVEIHGIQRKNISGNLDPDLLTIYENRSEQTELNQYKPPVMVFSSLIGSKRTIHSFAKSICLMYGKIFLVNFSVLVKESKKHSFKTRLESILNLIEEENVRKFIFIDVSSLLFWELYRIYQNIMQQSKILFIRPIFSLSELISPLSPKMLFCGGPFLLSRLRLLFYSSNLKELFKEKSETKDRNFDLANPNVMFIVPGKSMDLSIEYLISNQINNQSQIIIFRNGGWSFYKQETLIIGALNEFFNERSY